MVYEKAEVANEFNSFSTSVASKLVSKLPPSSGLYGSNQVKKYYVVRGSAKLFFFCKGSNSQNSQ
jgi:hypothetical protein